MVKKVRVVDGVEEEAGVRYEDTGLARRAVRSRRRLSGLLWVAAALLVLEAVAQGAPGWALVAVAVALAGWGTRQGRLGGVVAAGLVAFIAIGVPIRMLALGGLAASDAIALAVSAVVGLAALPDVILLLRDAELQHAYGRWARRD